MSVFSAIVFLIAFIASVKCQFCATPENYRGICKSVYDCPAIFDQLKEGSLTNEQTNYLRSLQCWSGKGRHPHVCCVEGNSVGETRRTEYSSYSSGVGTIIPEKGECGSESFGEKVYGGRATNIDEFPWLALLEYLKPNGIDRRLSCGGALINQRYVLTAAHCLIGEIRTKVGRLVNVRLGEYDITTDTDCKGDDCADPVLNMGVDDIIPHSGYTVNNRNGTHDIGLVRLDGDVIYTEFVKPICLPSTINLKRTPENELLHSVGWGRTLTDRQSTIKLKVQLPVVNHEKCRRKYETINTYLIDSQLCAGGNYAEDTCDGDSGGPLMKPMHNYWAIEGIVSFGRGCGLEGWPAIYTRVSSYESWIRNNLKP